MSSEEYTEVNESLEEGFNHGNPGRSPERPGDYTSTSLEEFYDDDLEPAERAAGLIDRILTSRPAVGAAGVAAGGEVINLLYNPVDLPVISQYPEAVAGAAVAGGGVLIYNAVSETGKYIQQLIEEEDEIEEVSLDDYLDLETVEGVEDAEERADAADRHVEELAEDFDVEEVEILTPELEEELAQMPGRLDS